MDGGRNTLERRDSLLIGRGGAAGAKVVVLSGPDEGTEVPLMSTVEIGSDEGCDLVLHDDTASRRHAVIALVAGALHVRDRGSLNGTFLGGSRVVEAEVPLGAILRIGKTVLAIQPRWHVRELPPSAARRFGEVLGESVAMRELFAILERVAPTDVTVLVEGESGTGKELVARSLHAASGRADGPYVVFDCGAVPRELAESELFGHLRGAFTGATGDRTGGFARAHGGTLCLDEIGELPPDLQPMLLRVLETGEIRPVGSDVQRKVDVRVVAATNRDLHAEVRHGRFRSDLLYRLDVVRVRVPPLAQRPEDIPPLVASFLGGHIDPDEPIGGVNLQRLAGYSWPGNVRELRNVLTRAVALARRSDRRPRFSELIINLGPGGPAPATLGAQFPGVAAPLPYKQAKAQLLASFERAYIDALLARHDSITRAAEAAGLSRKHLHDLIDRVSGIGDGDGD